MVLYTDEGYKYKVYADKQTMPTDLIFVSIFVLAIVFFKICF
jgi:hypothetical protein